VCGIITWEFSALSTAQGHGRVSGTGERNWRAGGQHWLWVSPELWDVVLLGGERADRRPKFGYSSTRFLIDALIGARICRFTHQSFDRCLTMHIDVVGVVCFQCGVDWEVIKYEAGQERPKRRSCALS